MTNKMIAAAVVAMAGVLAAGTAGAWCGCPAGGPGPQMKGGDRGPAAESRIEDRMASLESILTLKDNQKAAYKAYVDAKVKIGAEHRAWAEKHAQRPIDEQTRLDDRAARAKMNAELFSDVAAKRAALWQVLDPQQKLVLETYETHHGFGPMGGHRDFRRGPGPKFDGHPCPGAQTVPPCADGPRACPGFEGSDPRPDAPQRF